MENAQEQKPQRLYFKTYLQFIRNSVGSEMFRNFYIKTADGVEKDAMDDGSNSCAFFVSSVLTLFKKHSGIHGTVASTVEDLERNNWQQIEVGDMHAGDVLVWEPIELEGESHEHIGFYIGDGRAVSTSWTAKQVVEHDAGFGGERAVTQVFRNNNWE